MNINEWLPEFPVASEEDKSLLDYFVKTETVQQLEYGEKWLVLGRKYSKTLSHIYLRTKFIC